MSWDVDLEEDARELLPVLQYWSGNTSPILNLCCSSSHPWDSGKFGFTSAGFTWLKLIPSSCHWLVREWSHELTVSTECKAGLLAGPGRIPRSDWLHCFKIQKYCFLWQVCDGFVGQTSLCLYSCLCEGKVKALLLVVTGNCVVKRKG